MPSNSNEQGGALKLLDKNIRSIFIIFLFTFGIWYKLLSRIIEIKKSQQIGLIEQSAIAGYYLVSIIFIVCGMCVLCYVLISGIKLIKSEKEPQKTIEEKKEETQTETKLKVCPICDGKGNINCTCENGYLLPKLEGGGSGIDLQKEGNKWIYKISRISVRNIGIAGAAKLHVEVRNKYSEELLGERSEKVELIGYDWNRFDLGYNFDLGNLESLKKYIGDREPTNNDLSNEVYFTDCKPKEKCPRCNGAGVVVCWRCKGKKSA